MRAKGIGSRLLANRYGVPLAFLAIYLLAFLVLPVGTMIVQGITDGDNNPVAGHARLLLANPVYGESLVNSLGVAAGAAILAAAAALPIAMLLWRHHVRPSVFIELCGFVPLLVPPFVLALSLQALLGRGGALGLLFQSYGDLDPAIVGLPAVMVIEAIHYFPLVLIALLMSTGAHAQQAQEAALLGSRWPRLLWRVFMPLGMPGMAFGMTITFLKTLDDLATPLSLGVTNLLAPQAFFRVSAYGAQDPLASLLATLMIVISGLAWFFSVRLVRQHVAFARETSGHSAAFGSPTSAHAGVGVLAAILLFYAACYAGIVLASVARTWSYTLFPEAFSLEHYLTAIYAERGSYFNTLAYCGFAAVLDVIVGLIMAYTIGKASPRWKKRLTWAAVGLLSVPGVALGIAYLQFFRGVEVPLLGQPLDVTWFLLPMAFSVRGLPFAIRACSIALQSVPGNHVDAASLSGRSRYAVMTKIVLPTMGAGLLVAFLLCFGLAVVDLSTAMLLVPSETDATISYSIYLNMQSTTGRGVGAALAVLSIGFAALALCIFLALIRRNRRTTPGFGKLAFTGN